MNEINPLEQPLSSLNATTQMAACMFLEQEKELGRFYSYIAAFDSFYVAPGENEKCLRIHTKKLKSRFVAWLIQNNKMEPYSMTLDDVKAAWEFVKAIIISESNEKE